MILPLFHTLRFKLLLMFVAVFGVLALLVGLVAVRYQETQLRRFFQDRLSQRVDSMVQRIREAGPVPSDELIQELIDREGDSIFFRDFYVQILDASGRPRGVSKNLGQYMLPTDSLTSARPGELSMGYFETITGPEVEEVAGTGQTMQMVTRRSQTALGEPFYLQVATSLEAVEWSIDNLVLMYYGATAMGLVAAAAAGWFVAGRVVTRINRIGRLASEVGPQNLGQRIRAPSTTDEIAELVLRLNSMLDRLEAGFHSQERFIQDASHELKTPIATLLTESQVMKMSSEESPELRDFAASVEDEMRRLGRMLESLLTLTRVDRLKELHRPRPVSLSSVALDAVERCRPAAQRQGVRLNLEVPDPEASGDSAGPGQPTVVGDAELLVVAISNVVRNAIRFSPRDQAVTIAVRDGQTPTVAVRDHGPGLPEGDPAVLFERFGHGPPDLSRRGAGLGLAIVKTVVELHQGSVSAVNHDGGGAEFAISFPRPAPGNGRPEAPFIAP